MDLEELENRINNNTRKLENLTKKIEDNLSRINENKEKIDHNTGVLALLHTIKTNGDKYFIIWMVTFIAFLMSIGYIVYLHTDIEKVTTQEVEQENESGSNNYIGGDGEING